MSLSEIEAQLSIVTQQATEDISAASGLDELDRVRVKYLGKKGDLSKVLGGMGKLSAEDRPKVGAIANQAKAVLQSHIEQRKNNLQTEQIQSQLASETIDVTMPGVYQPQGRIHPINSIIDQITDIFVGLGYTVAQSQEIESDYYNFEALNFLPDHPARDMQDTLYLPGGQLMRTHTSNTQIRYMENHEPPMRVLASGRCYRRDTVDATHAAVFHQIEFFAVDKNITFTDLRGTVQLFLEALFGDIEVRFRPSYFPFTEPSAEVDVRWQGQWLEVMGCGMIDPNVLKAVGCDPEVYSGFAAGLGVERLAMVQSKIDDIRRLYSSDLRFLNQF
ncbi:MAG: phenylalanyl-tRNA synthetase alpha subunit PheS [Phormidesmis priestleyi Ana]|uniref:Phenylalanine--tRNA ligase alpha subunit n=1 Tax=Phormidesmis priestleyi Ana TaxID=1666911 RepID=A0A0P8C2U9_9CYAN|nr:MAG: phenylalanyl-tRNA synthetase alpha subunit PheS [Phormidesmis priestleyi Ana]